ncbi:MAG: reverse transcriptase family protein [Clostridiaceae bacterium]|jgi:hypothetical protein|nr:reverse transcriptase family protein [Clostridiaceae bacterium]
MATELRRTLENVLGAETLESILVNSRAFYDVYYIKKQSGGSREICKPRPQLLSAIRIVLPYLQRIPAGKYVAAYEKGCSVKRNAQKHARGKHLLHLDIKDFFPSVSRRMFMETYKKVFAAADLDMVWNIISFNDGLPIGSPASPFVANRVLYGLDKKLGSLSFFVKYTRYADDMIFSSRRYIQKVFISQAEAAVKAAGFSLNPNKTYCMSSRKQVTGIIITDKGKLSVGTTYKKTLKGDIYKLLLKDEGDKSVIKGRFSYLAQIEPDYAEVIRKKYQAYDRIGFFGKKR